MTNTTLYSVPPQQLVTVRQLSHAAVQWPSRAARANLEAAADDSHSNLGWDEQVFGLLSHPLDESKRYQLGFSFRPFSLVWMADGEVATSLNLEQSDETSAKAWCDARLSAVGLHTTDSAEMPYTLDPVNDSDLARQNSPVEFEVLGCWYSKAQVTLDTLVAEFGELAVSTPTVRCWPHHYDLATLFVLEEGDAETARSVGVGLSPGDGSYAEPYFYCTPWPAPEQLGDAPAPMHWHMEGFTSLVCPASRVDVNSDLYQVLKAAMKVALTAVP